MWVLIICRNGIGNFLKSNDNKVNDDGGNYDNNTDSVHATSNSDNGIEDLV